jgi:phage terminase large subunit-like protein
MKEFERMAYNGTNVIDQNEATRYCFSNVEIKTDFHGNCKPFKKDMADARKIDGVIAMLMTLGGYLTHEELHVSDAVLVG